jgi:hypothetical protein
MVFLSKVVSILVVIYSFCFAQFAYGQGGHPEKEHEHVNSLPAHHKPFDSDFWKRIDPEFNIVGNFLTEFSDNKDNSNRGKFRVREAEAAFQAFLLPQFRINAVGAMEQEYDGSHLNTEFHLEEFYGALFDLPYDVDAQDSLGRKTPRLNLN